MTDPKRVGQADLEAALRALLAEPGAAFEATWSQVRDALRAAPAATGVESAVPNADDVEATAVLQVEVLPKGSRLYEVFPVRQVYTDSPPPRGRLSVALDASTGNPGLFAPASWRADWSSVRLRHGQKTFTFASGPGAPMGPAAPGRTTPALTAEVDDETRAVLLSLASKKTPDGEKA